MNIAEILKNVPKGTKLYSPIFGEVTFMCVKDSNIKVSDLISIVREFYHDGKFYKNGECMLFPSRENRDWDKFCEFKEGDILISESGNPFIFKRKNNSIFCSIYCGINTSDLFWKDSDQWTNITKARKATEEEIKLFLDRLEKEGYRWDSNNLILEKISKFDITTLKPFDKVLVRDSDMSKWTCGIYSHLYNNGSYRYVCINRAHKQCIPYNEDTKHLVGTTNDCPEYYKTW